jgi:hypothetical protein
MLKDFTRNLFYFFRGPSSDDDPAHDRQLENNLTKSLIVVLEHADSVFLQAFAQRLGLAPPDELPRFSLQRRPVGVQTTPKRVVVGITGGTTEHMELRSAADGGRPDAWILTDKWTVLVESKLGSKIDEDQLHRHARSAGWTRDYDVRYLTWQEIYTIVHDELMKLGNRNPTSRLLVSQWLDYLRGQQMIPFEKLESDDFDYFNLSEDDQRPLMSHVHRRVEEFQELLAKTAPAASILKCCNLENNGPWMHGARKKGEHSAWFNVGGEGAARNWHVTVYFRPNGVDVEVLGASKDLTRRLAKAGKETVANLVRLCSEGSETASIAVGCRRAWYANPESGYKGQRIDHADAPLMGHPSFLADSTRDEFAKVLRVLLEKDKDAADYRTELTLQYSIPRQKITHGDLSSQIDLVADALSKIEEPLRFLLDLGKA